MLRSSHAPVSITCVALPSKLHSLRTGSRLQVNGTLFVTQVARDTRFSQLLQLLDVKKMDSHLAIRACRRKAGPVGAESDAFYFVARLNRHDQHHRRVVEFSRGFRAQLLTTDWVRRFSASLRRIGISANLQPANLNLLLHRLKLRITSQRPNTSERIRASLRRLLQ